MLNSKQQTANSKQPNYYPKLRVLYVTCDKNGGGATLSLLPIMRDMKERYNVEPVYLAKSETEFTQICRDNGIEVIVQNYYPWVVDRDTLAGKLKVLAKKIVNRLLHADKKIIALLKNKHFDIIHTNSSFTEMGDIISQHYSVPHVQHIRESGYYYYYYPDEYVRAVHSRAAANIVISQSNYEVYVNERKLCPAENTHIIYNGLVISEAYDKRKADGNNINFCIVGSIHFFKNQLMAVKACEKLKTLTHNFTLHIIGEDVLGYEKQVRSFVRSHQLDDCVKFWGYRSDVDDILHDMDVGLMLSTREGFGRVTVEYMLNYMPVIGVDTGATPEIVIDGETGFICHINDTDTLAQLMHKFITNPELIPAMGSKGRERAAKNFSLERNTDEIYALYQEIMSRNNPPQ